ncbi:MAG: M28 family peptidase [Lewinellaceae bacterium]|nr:M28 family peptidase [Saprospiraceae bacterium]MCB9345280.1 M28 family peptidase [Lewinellaceae bacterium]
MKFKLLICSLFLALSLSAQVDGNRNAGYENDTNTSYTGEGKGFQRHYDLADATPFANDIKASDLKALLDVLASDTLQGRETGEPGQWKAADFIASQFKQAGIAAKADRNSYFQNILLRKTSWSDIGLVVGTQEFRNRSDFYVYPALTSDAPKTSIKDLVFVGYGIEDAKYNDYEKADVRGKAVIFYDGEPLDTKGNSLITGTEFRTSWSLNWRKKVKLAKDKGATMVFIIDPNFEESVKKNRQQISTYGWKPEGNFMGTDANDLINCLFLSQSTADAILGKKAGKAENEFSDLRNGKKFKPVKIKSKVEVRLAKVTKELKGSNVLAVIEGTDSVLKKEYVFVTAHYDHLGMADSTVIYNGADDNASGTSGVIEIARAFQAAKDKGIGPKRTVVCMLVSGEEKGLLGSKYYTEFPLFPLDKTVVDVNIDMIGRVDERHADNPDYVYVIGADRISTDLHKINEAQNFEHTKLELDYRYNAKDDPNHYYERSDHYNFAEKGIPAIFFFNGTHPDYHRPTDTADKINFEALAKRAQLAFYTAWEVANRPFKLSRDIWPDKN